MPPNTGPSRGPTGRFEARERGQMGPIGIALLVAIVVIGSVSVVSVGAATLADARQSSAHQQVEHAMTQFDSRESVVALGDAGIQTVALGNAGRGQYVVEPDAGWISVTHQDYDGQGSNETIYNGSLGAMVYRDGDTVIAHQGGGVWRLDGDAAVMVSPPELHYQAETLVLPIVQVEGDDSAGGPTRATVTTVQSSKRVFPSGADGGPGPGAPYDATQSAYLNPISGGSVWITVHSEFYEAWGRFLQTRTEGTVRLDHDRKLATVKLTAPRTLGDFDMPDEGNHIDILGIPDGHAVDVFTVQLAPDDEDAARFFNLQWSMYVKEGKHEFELHLRLTGPADDDDTACKEQDVAATVYYSGTNGNPYQAWKNDQAFRTECVDRDGDGLDDEVQLVANFTGDTPLAPSTLSKDDLLHFNPSKADAEPTITFDQHDDVAWEPETFDDDDEVAIGRLVNHYLGLLGQDYDLVIDDKNSDTVNEGASSGELWYAGEGRVTFMHITEDRVRVVLTAGGP